MASTDKNWHNCSPAVSSLLQQVMLVDPPTVAAHTPVAVAVRHLAQTGCILILDQQRPIGVFTERDLVGLIAAESGWKQPIFELPISALMVQPLICCAITERLTLLLLVERMQQYSVQYLPVVDAEEHLVGLITQTLVLQALAAEHQRCSTDRKQAELALQEREYLLRTLGDNLPKGLIYQFVHEPPDRYYFTYISAGIERLVGVKPEAVLEDPNVLHDLIVEADRQQMAELTERSRQTLSLFEMQMRKRTLAGGIQWSQLRSAPRRLADGRTVWDGIELDITELKQVEADLQQAKVAAEAANRAKSIFLANVTHELRTPLNAILGFSQLLAQDDSLTEMQRRHIAIINRSGEELLSLINRILDLSRLESQPWSPKLNDLTADLVSESTSAALNEFSTSLNPPNPPQNQSNLSLLAEVSTSSADQIDPTTSVGNSSLASSDSLLTAANLAADALLVMPLAWLEQLYRAAIQLDEKTLFALIQSLPTEHAALAQALTLKIEEFEFEQIMQWSQQAIEQLLLG